MTDFERGDAVTFRYIDGKTYTEALKAPGAPGWWQTATGKMVPTKEMEAA